MIKLNSKTIFIAGAILLIAISRLMPHLPNFTPVAAMALFGGAMLSNKKWAYIITIAALLISDLLVNTILYSDTNFVAYFKEPYVWSIYFSFIVTVFLGSKMGNQPSALKIGAFSISSSLIFWTLTNFACWPGNPLYTQDLNGLATCYVAAIPFLGNIAGDLFYSALLFGTFYLAAKKVPALVRL